MAHITGSLQVTNAGVVSWTQGTGILSLNNPTGNVTVTCIATANAVTVSYSNSHASRTDSNLFYVNEGGSVTIRAATGYIFESGATATVSNATGVSTSISEGGKLATITFTPTAAAGTSGCTIALNPIVYNFTYSITLTNCAQDVEEQGGDTISLTGNIQEGLGTLSMVLESRFGYYFAHANSSYMGNVTKTGNATVTFDENNPSSDPGDAYWDTQMRLNISNVTSNITVTVAAVAATFSVYMSVNTGETGVTFPTPNPVTATYGGENSQISIPNGTSKTDWTLTGWGTTNGGSDNKFNATNGQVPMTNTYFSSTQRSITIYPRWSVTKYTVTVTYTHCSEYENDPSTVSVTTDNVNGAQLTVVPDFGYYFKWDVDSGFDDNFTPGTGVTVLRHSSTSSVSTEDEITITIKASQNSTLTIAPFAETYRIAYAAGTGGSGSISTQSYVYDSGTGTNKNKMTVSDGTGFTKQYHHISNWSSSYASKSFNLSQTIDVNTTNFGRGSNTPGSVFDGTAGTRTITLTAIWVGNDYNITVNASNGCSNDASSDTTINRNGTAQVKINASSGYTLPTYP